MFECVVELEIECRNCESYYDDSIVFDTDTGPSSVGQGWTECPNCGWEQELYLEDGEVHHA